MFSPEDAGLLGNLFNAKPRRIQRRQSLDLKDLLFTANMVKRCRADFGIMETSALAGMQPPQNLIQAASEDEDWSTVYQAVAVVLLNSTLVAVVA